MEVPKPWSVIFALAGLALGCSKTGADSDVSREQNAAQAQQSTPSASSPKISSSAASETQHGGAHAEVEQGAQLYARYCALCHGASATGYAADNAPSLVSKTFLESATDEFIARGIRMGRPNTAMAAYGRTRGGPLAETDIDAIVAYLRSRGPAARQLPSATPGGDRKLGSQLFDRHCVECHGDASKRGTAPSLHNPEFLAAASPAFIEYAITHGRPPTPMLPFAGKLSKSEIAALVSFLQSMAPTTPTAPVKSSTVPADLPMVINPSGEAPKFTLRSGRFVGGAQVAQALKEKRRIVIIDARSPADWIQFHIPGSVPVAYYETERLTRVPNDGTWVVAYCACPHHASGEVVDALRKRGYKNTAVLDEGILWWRDRGYPLEGEALTKPPGASPPPTAQPSTPPSPPKK